MATFHLDDRLCPFNREDLRAEAWLMGYQFAKRHQQQPEEVSEPEPEFKPKFSIGDWITDSVMMYKILDIDMNYNYYKVVSSEGKYNDLVFSWYDREFRLATKEEIEMVKTSGTFPKFKVGDIIRLKDSLADYTIERISDGCYHGRGWSIGIGCQDDYELVTD